MNIRPEVLDAIREHAEREAPRECCGILVGVGDNILEAVGAANVAAEPLRRYEVSPADHFTQIKRCRELAQIKRCRELPQIKRSRATTGPHALQIIGVYHSHPHSAPVPSPTDLDQAFEEYVYVIAGPVDGSAPFEIRGYRLVAGTFIEVQLTATRAEDAD